MGLPCPTLRLVDSLDSSESLENVEGLTWRSLLSLLEHGLGIRRNTS